MYVNSKDCFLDNKESIRHDINYAVEPRDPEKLFEILPQKKGIIVQNSFSF